VPSDFVLFSAVVVLFLVTGIVSCLVIITLHTLFFVVCYFPLFIFFLFLHSM